MGDFEEHLKRAELRNERLEKIEAIREKNNLIDLVIKLNVSIISILCATYALYMSI